MSVLTIIYQTGIAKITVAMEIERKL
jgi:hypothetical protein